MRKFTAVLCAAAMAFSMAATAMATDSKTSDGFEGVTITDEVKEALGGKVLKASADIDLDKIENETVKTFAEDYKAGKIKTGEDVIASLGLKIDSEEDVKVPEECKFTAEDFVKGDVIVPPSEVVIGDEGSEDADSYDADYFEKNPDATVDATLQADGLKGADVEKLIPALIDTKTGKVTLLVVDEKKSDMEKGELALALSGLGLVVTVEAA